MKTRSVAFLLLAVSFAGAPTVVAEELQSSFAFRQYLYGDVAAAMVVGDFDRDGNLDIATNPAELSYWCDPWGYYPCSTPFIMYQSRIVIYFGNGDGTFHRHLVLEAASGYLDLATADFDNDGNIDLVAATEPLSVFMGNGDGSFQPMETYQGGKALWGVVARDLDGDGFPDLAVTDNKNGFVSVLLNKSDHDHGARFKDKVQYRVGEHSTGLESGDLNGDGVPDLVAYYALNQAVAVLLGEGGGKFRHYVETPIFTDNGPFYGRDLALADFNGDRRQDLVVPVGGGIYVLYSNGDGTFTPPAGAPGELVPMPGYTRHVDTGDFNGDGRPDILAGNYLIYWPWWGVGGCFTVLYGDEGPFKDAARDVVCRNYDYNVVAADINGDSLLDVVSDGNVFLNNGTAVDAHTEDGR